MSKDTIYARTVDEIFLNKKHHQASKAPVNTLSKLHRPVWVPPRSLQRPVYDFAEGVTARSMYDGELK